MRFKILEGAVCVAVVSMLSVSVGATNVDEFVTALVRFPLLIINSQDVGVFKAKCESLQHVKLPCDEILKVIDALKEAHCELGIYNPWLFRDKKSFQPCVQRLDHSQGKSTDMVSLFCEKLLPLATASGMPSWEARKHLKLLKRQINAALLDIDKHRAQLSSLLESLKIQKDVKSTLRHNLLGKRNVNELGSTSSKHSGRSFNSLSDEILGTADYLTDDGELIYTTDTVDDFSYISRGKRKGKSFDIALDEDVSETPVDSLDEVSADSSGKAAERAPVEMDKLQSNSDGLGIEEFLAANSVLTRPPPLELVIANNERVRAVNDQVSRELSRIKSRVLAFYQENRGLCDGALCLTQLSFLYALITLVRQVGGPLLTVVFLALTIALNL